ncbi:MAG: hypothetical protein WDN48_16135 [Pseudolabrys sp.]
MPTNLPRPRVIPKRSIFSVVLNTFMVGSILILTFMVLMQEERYAMGQPGYTIPDLVQVSLQTPPDMTGETQAVLRPD